MTQNADWCLCSLRRVTPATKRTGLTRSFQSASLVSKHLLLILFFLFLFQSSNDGADFKHFWGGFPRLCLFIHVKRIFISRAQLNLDGFNTFIVYGAFLRTFLRRQVEIGHIVSDNPGSHGLWSSDSLTWVPQLGTIGPPRCFGCSFADVLS